MLDKAEKNLERQLEWIARYDTRIAFIAGIAIAMLGVLANAGSTVTFWSADLYWLFLIAIVLLLACLTCIYFGQYPTMRAKNESLLYFGSIADLSFVEFSKRFRKLSDDDYLTDLLHQIHRNSLILKDKFLLLRAALILLLCAVLPWMLFIHSIGE